MSKNFENKYANFKNYELETMFDLSKREKQELVENIEPKTKHAIKLQELYLKMKSYTFEQLELEVNEYLGHNEYLLEKEQIGKFYELLAFAAADKSNNIESKYLKLSVETFPTLYCLKRAIYQALAEKNIYLGARLMLIAIEADIEFDAYLSYYNLVVEHFFEDDIEEYYNLMQNYHDKYISVDNITIEFKFNKLIVNYYLHKHILETEANDVLKAKKEINELLLQTISSMKDEGELRSQVLRVREALATIDKDDEFDIFDLITFNLLPKPNGEPESSPLSKIK
ncbi:hypothetical protein RZE82_00480 [Mollicutes bacterium LVI A0039]|nr:hypothetical protein RZE82_00480 [Mollicutes bacterium LVI A0039]